MAKKIFVIVVASLFIATGVSHAGLFSKAKSKAKSTASSVRATTT